MKPVEAKEAFEQFVTETTNILKDGIYLNYEQVAQQVAGTNRLLVCLRLQSEGGGR